MNPHDVLIGVLTDMIKVACPGCLVSQEVVMAAPPADIVVWCPAANGILFKSRAFAVYIGDPMAVLAYPPLGSSTVHAFYLSDPDFCSRFPQFLREHYYPLMGLEVRVVDQ